MSWLLKEDRVPDVLGEIFPDVGAISYIHEIILATPGESQVTKTEVKKMAHSSTYITYPKSSK